MADENNREWEVSTAQMCKTHGFSMPNNQKRLNEQAKEAKTLAEDILKLCRNTLLINLRFLESALVRFIPNNDTVTMTTATDGRYMYYNSAYICGAFKKAPEIPVRDYLHLVLHCLFRHLFIGSKLNRGAWDLACDIAVENIISNLNIKSLYCEREEHQKWLIKKLNGELPGLSAERIYRWLLNQENPLESSDIARLREPFYSDDHSIWHNAPDKDSDSSKSDERDPSDEGADDDGDPDYGSDGACEELLPDVEGNEDDEKSLSASEKNGQDEQGKSTAGNENDRDDQSPGLTPEETEQLWKDISERIEVDLETMSNTWGESAGDLKQSLAEINKEKYDYGEFLRRFAVLGENIEVNDEEFDYIYYTYGMKLYKKMPLVEPLEYKEVKRVKEFVIALDTSESVAGDLVQKFVTKTWNILKQSENFFTHVNVHILQCGARVEEDAKITNEDEFDEYMRRMVLCGFGGTDFRPVFEYVDGLVKQHEFRNFRGMIYFTDGYGTFPAMPPQYDVAFVFLNQGRDIPDIPIWAIKLLLSEEDIEVF